MDKFKQKFSLLIEKQFILHTGLISFIHILSVYRTIKESEYPISEVEMGISVILIVLITIISFFLSKYILKDKIKASILTTLFLFVSFNFAVINKGLFQIHTYAGLAERFFFGNQILTSVALLSFTFFLLAYIIFILPFKLIRFNAYLNVLLLLFLVVEFKNLYFFEPKTIKLTDEIQTYLQNESPKSEWTALPDSLRRILKNSPLSAAIPSGNDSTFAKGISDPNIYYIVLDSYTNFESLKKYWKFDNSELTNFLIKRGFYVARRSKSNYNQTHFTIASTFNLSYLHYESFDKLTFAHYPNLFKLIKNNTLVNILEKNGYQIINYSLFDISNTSKFYRFELLDEPHFFKNTLFEGIINIDKVGVALGLNFEPEIDIIKINLDLASKLKDVTLKNLDNSFFVYAHFMLPHPPYYFDAKGNIMPDNYARDDSNMWKYLEQLKFTNKLLMELVDFILSNSNVKPVIIIQADHGFRFLKDETAQESESHAILNAFYFPDRDYKLLYPTVSSVNTFRILLRKYNFLDIETLPDEIFFVALVSPG